jgi:hypothetical protein
MAAYGFGKTSPKHPSQTIGQDRSLEALADMGFEWNKVRNRMKRGYTFRLTPKRFHT